MIFANLGRGTSIKLLYLVFCLEMFYLYIPLLLAVCLRCFYFVVVLLLRCSEHSTAPSEN